MVEEAGGLRLAPGTTVTIIDLSHEADRVLTLGDVLVASPGVQVRSSGGTGQAQSLGIRGASGGEVRVLVDGVPMAQDGTGALDLASLPLDNVIRIEVYRGAPPPGMGAEGVAGAINLVTRAPEGKRSVDLSAGVGSFHTAEGSARVELGHGPWSGSVWLGGQTARNDFTFYDDNGTPYTALDDDPDALRINADAHRGEFALRGRRDGMRRDLDLKLDGLFRELGVPGPASYQVTGVRLGEARLLAGVRLLDPSDRPWTWDAGLALEADQQHLLDSEGQVGLGEQDYKASSNAGTVDLALRRDFEDQLRVSGSTRLASETWAGQDRLLGGETAVRRRHRLGLGADARIPLQKGGLALALALDLARTSADGIRPGSLDAPPQDAWNVLLGPSGSLSLPLHDGEHLQAGLRAGGGRSHRLPTFAELYGEQGGVTGNEDLAPEQAWNVDAGFDLVGGAWGGAGSLGFTGYFRRVADYIGWVQNSQYTVHAENFALVRAEGLEVEGEWRGHVPAARVLRLGLAYTLTHTLNLGEDPTTYGCALPGQPLNSLFADLELGPDVLQGGWTTEYESGSYLDSANLVAVPDRVLHHIRLASKPWTRGPQATLELRNLMDLQVEHRSDLRLTENGEPAPQAVCDYWGYPLPGRALYLSLGWKLGSGRSTGP